MKWPRRRDPRLRDELRYHRDRLIEDYIAAGMDRTAAERRAFLEFGNVAGLEEQVRDVRGRWVARPARILESRAAQRLQSALRAVHQRTPVGTAG
jgi:hypothetical protein